MLVSELIDRTLNEWLHPGSDEQPQFDTLDGAIDDATLDIVLDGRAEFVPRDTVLQIGTELILVKSATGPSVTAVERGFAGTTAAAHADGDIVWVDPVFTRIEILHAVRSIIGKLYTWGVYDRYVDTSLTYTTRNVLATTTRTKRIHSILVRKNTEQELYTRLSQRGVDWVEYREFDPVKFWLRRSGAEGSTMTVVCVRDFDLPDDESVDLTADTRIPEGLQEDLPMAVAGQVLKGREVPRAVVDRIREVLAAQGQNPMQIMNVGDALINAFRRDAVIAERRRLDDTDEPTFEWQRR